jgi:hypothetical protein
MAARSFAAQWAHPYPQRAGVQPGGNLPGFRVRNSRNQELFCAFPENDQIAPFSLTTMMKQKAY